MGAGVLPTGVIICIPARATDTWLATALDPSIPDPEDDLDPLAHLVRLGVLHPAPQGESQPRKSQYAYRERASDFRGRVDQIRPLLPELDRFMHKLERCAQ